MRSRDRRLGYAGALGRVTLAQAQRLGEGYAVQPKIDGQYVELHLDGSGLVDRVISRGGREIKCDLIGLRAGLPGSVLVGELEAHTERGRAAARRRGWANCHLFDAIRAGARDVSTDPYRMRRDWLYRGWAACDCLTAPSDTYLTRSAGRLRARTTGRFLPPQSAERNRFPIVTQRPIGEASELYDSVLDAGGEGIVIVALDAPIGKRGAKRKCKPRDSIDAKVIARDARSAMMLWERGTFAVGIGQKDVAVGQIWEVTHEGYYATGEPRFARLTRLRSDLAH